MTSLRLHHVNVTSDDMGSLTDFYKNALGLELLTSPAMIATTASDNKDGDAEWQDGATFFNAGHPAELQLHATRRQPYLAAQEGRSVNPLVQGHFAFRTDDIKGVKKKLSEHGIPFDDWGIWSVKGWHQIFFTDPAGNMIEVHQVFRQDDR